MLSDIKKSIARKLKEDLKIEAYTEKKEGIDHPYFYIKLLRSEQKEALKGRCQRLYSYQILYYPNDKTNNGKLDEVGESLYGVLEYIETDNSLIKASQMAFAVYEDYFDFTINFNLHFKKQLKDEEEAPAMGQLQSLIGKAVG